MRIYADKKEAQAIKKSLKLLLERCTEQGEKETVQTLLDRVDQCLDLQGKPSKRRR